MKGLIPRGLRVQIFPTFEAPGPEFKENWETILSECSFKLMDLLIAEEEKKLSLVEGQIQEVHTKMDRIVNHGESLPRYESIMKGIQKLETSLLDTKKTKLARDIKDYSSNSVYRWTHRNINFHNKTVPRPKRVIDHMNSRSSIDLRVEDPTYIGINNTVFDSGKGSDNLELGSYCYFISHYEAMLGLKCQNVLLEEFVPLLRVRWGRLQLASEEVAGSHETR
ncbi:hypothetical protein XELAEV_18007520mg [Xenopus laevis]|uniref:Uncharacterized protein n=1 Tax=Xenopus laevis TaxID=8355 RepID=A0A974E1A5_XENLA|nr:hypothetical protein XELAEV_18007520mg [Xenopus laevis]